MILMDPFQLSYSVIQRFTGEALILREKVELKLFRYQPFDPTHVEIKWLSKSQAGSNFQVYLISYALFSCCSVLLLNEEYVTLGSY